MDSLLTERSAAGAGEPGAGPVRPQFSERELRAVREGIDGVKGMIPARCYYDEDIYAFEVEHILKKNWLCVGRWDWAEKPGDYFTRRMFGEPIVVIRDHQNRLRALINVCRHRWSQIMPDGAGNTNLLVCPYHSWTYNLDGSLRGMAVQDMPEVDKSSCALPSLRLEEWQGMVFINFDPDAEPLGPQLAGASELIARYGVGDYRTAGRADYDTTWNYKFSFETGYEAYHHEGIHKSWLGGTAAYHKPFAFGKIWGAYVGIYPPGGDIYPFGPPPWKSKAEIDEGRDIHIFIGIYPNLITFISSHQISMITTEFMSATANRATTSIAIAPWALERPGADAAIAEHVKNMLDTQDEDTRGCTMLQLGIASSYNTRSVIHPIESQLSHYYNWLMDNYISS